VWCAAGLAISRSLLRVAHTALTSQVI
jgi:hypothetical protein